MKRIKTIFVLLLGLLHFSLSLRAADNNSDENVLSAQNLTSEYEETSSILPIVLDNPASITGFQLDLYLPEGLTVATEGDEDDYAIGVLRTENGKHRVSALTQPDGALRIVCRSMTNFAFQGNSGTVMNIVLNVDENMEAGTYQIMIKNIVMTDAASNRYTSSDVICLFTKQEPPVPVIIQGTTLTMVYGDDVPELTYDVICDGGVTLQGIPLITCEVTSSSPVGIYPIIVEIGSVTNKAVTLINGTLTITKAPLTIAAGTYTKKQGEENPEFVLSYEGFKNNETEDVLTTKPTATTSATVSSEPGEYEIVVGGGEAQNYELSYMNGKLTIIDADPIKLTAKSYSREYGEANPVFEFSVEGAALDGNPEIICEATATSPVGEYPIIIKKGSVRNYNDSYVNGVLTITKAPLTIAAGTYTKKQGEENPEFVLSYEGFKNNETEDVLTTMPTATTSATVSSEPGEYEIVVSGGEAQNYEISYVNGKLIVTDADPVTVTANSYTIAYGDAIPELGYTSSGATLSGTPAISCEATSASPVGTYPIVISKGSVTNYNDNYVNGTLTITKAPLTIVAGTYTKKQGEENPEFVLSYEGFKNNETEDVLTAKPTATTSATVSSEPGEYEIIVSGGEAQNYELSYMNGKLTIIDADPIKLTAMSYTREYGEANLVFEFSVEGAALDGEPEIICEATATSPVGEYPIIIRKGSVRNYNDSYVNGVLTITKAPLTVTANDVNMEEWSPELPALTLTYEGWKNGEDESVLIEKPIATTSATIQSPIGEYPIVVSGGKAVNYSFIYVDGKFIITEPDRINAVKASERNDAIYDLNGRPVQHIGKGVYIRKGKKVLVK